MHPFPVLFLATISRAYALGCHEIQELISEQVPASLIAQTIRAAAPHPTVADLNCLIAAQAPADVIEAVRSVNALQPLQPREEPSSSVAGRQGPGGSGAQESSQSVGLIRQYDCLGDVCLNSLSASEVPDTLVTIGGRYSAYRVVEVCAGRVVSVNLYRAFVLGGRGSSALPDAATASGPEATIFLNYLATQLTDLGWLVVGSIPAQDEILGAVDYRNTDVDGRRTILTTLVAGTEAL